MKTKMKKGSIAMKPKGQKGKTFAQEAKYERAKKKHFGMK